MIQRMILTELLKVFVLSLAALTGLLLLVGVFTEASRNGLSPTQILAIIPYLIPSTLPYTLPTTTLFATCVIYGRLAADNEILALKAAGIHLMRVVWPGILLGIAASAVTMFLYYRTIPRTHYLIHVKFLSDLEDVLLSMAKRDGRIVHPKLNYEIYVKRVRGKKLLDAQFMRRAPSGNHYDLIARAREATLTVDRSRQQILVHTRYCRLLSDNGDPAYLDNKDWPLDLPPDLGAAEKTRTNDLTWQEMRSRRQQLVDKKKELQVDIACRQAFLAMSAAPAAFAAPIRQLESCKRRDEQEIREIDVESHQRPAVALGCLCFVLIGCPVGIWLSRSDYLSAFIICFLPIVLIYYPLLLCGINLGRFGHVPPALSLWSADALMGLSALVLYRRLLQH
jgi:lipopolysaccharide export system permease protein